MKNPIIPFIAVFCVMAFGVIGYQVFRLVLVKDVALEQETSATPSKKTGNVFTDLAINHPKAEVKRRNSKGFLRQSYYAQPYPHNIMMGNEKSDIKLTIFTDIACFKCRQRVSEVLRLVPLEDVHVIFKYAPVAEDNMKSGLFEQIARSKNVLEGFRERAYEAPEDLSDTFMMRTLSELGVSYKEQQTLLKNEPGGVARKLDLDLYQGDQVGLVEIPTFFLNRYRMSPKTLALDKIALYVNRLKAGKPLQAESLLRPE